MRRKVQVLVAGCEGESTFDEIDREGIFCRISRVRTPVQLLKKLCRTAPDAVFLDTTLSAGTRPELASCVRDICPDVRLILVMDSRDFSALQSAMKLGVFRVLVAPCTREQVLEALEGLPEKERKRAAEEDTDRTGSMSSYLMDSALSYIREHYREKITLTQVSEHIYCSSWYLSRLFTMSGRSFPETVNSFRIGEAIRLMGNPGVHLCEIAKMAGFSDSTQFSHVFRDQTGMTPGEYRRRKLNADLKRNGTQG